MAPDRTSVYVADDHPMYRAALARGVRERPDFELVGEGDDGREALEAIRELRPDVAVIDVKMPGLSGLEVVGATQRDRLPTRIVLLTGYMESNPAYRAVAEGAGAYLSKASDHKVLGDAIAAVARGETVIGAEFQAGLADEIRLRERDERPALTDREREVLRLAAGGRSVAEIGEDLHLSGATVKTHLHHAYEKLGVSDRAAAVASAMRQGLIE
jgi:two-component system nitrate/nitrite response regulator NarL